MFQEAYEKLSLEETARLLDQVNPLMDGVTFDPVESVVMGVDVDFYPGLRLFDIGDFRPHPPVHRYVVGSFQAGFRLLDFTNAPIYELNKTVPVALSDGNIADYARFFFTYVRGKHGRFIICENVDDIPWKDDPPPAARKAIGKMITPITILGRADDGSYRLELCMVFKDSLFKSKAEIKADGLVTLSDEELLIEDMPVLDDVFGL